MLKLLFTALLMLLALYLIAAVVVVIFFSAHVQTNAQGATLLFGPHGEIPPSTAGMVRFSDQPVITRITGIVDVAVAMLPILFIFLHLRGLFGLYAAGIVFWRENATHLKRIGIWLIVYPFAKFAANMLFRMAGGLDHAWFHVMGVQALVLGLIVVAIAQVMEFGHEIEQENVSLV